MFTLQVHGGWEHGRPMVLVARPSHDSALPRGTGQVVAHGRRPGVVGPRHGGGVPVAHLRAGGQVAVGARPQPRVQAGCQRTRGGVEPRGYSCLVQIRVVHDGVEGR